MSEKEIFQVVKLAMKSSKEKFGLDPKENKRLLFRLGLELGHSVSKTLKGKSIDEVLEEIVNFWNYEGFGKMKISSYNPIILEGSECYDCLGLRYGVGELLCPFKEGFLKALLEDKLSLKVEVKELECCGTFHNGCKFKIVIG